MDAFPRYHAFVSPTSQHRVGSSGENVATIRGGIPRGCHSKRDYRGGCPSASELAFLLATVIVAAESVVSLASSAASLPEAYDASGNTLPTLTHCPSRVYLVTVAELFFCGEAIDIWQFMRSNYDQQSVCMSNVFSRLHTRVENDPNLSHTF